MKGEENNSRRLRWKEEHGRVLISIWKEKYPQVPCGAGTLGLGTLGHWTGTPGLGTVWDRDGGWDHGDWNSGLWPGGTLGDWDSRGCDFGGLGLWYYRTG